MSNKKITDAVEIMDRRYRDQVANWDEEVAEEEMRVRVGITILRLRQAAGLTQQELAERMKITQSMLSQIENADYEGGALDMLWRVCKALHIELDFSCRERGSRKKTCHIALSSVLSKPVRLA